MDDPKFVLNQPAYRQAKILVADRNFGGGSSREQAPWALSDYGIRCVIAADFGDIFYLNSLKTGVLPIALDFQNCVDLRKQLHDKPGATMKVDLPAQTVTGPDGRTYRFEIDAFRKKCLVEGLDDIGVTLQHEAAIAAFEARYRKRFDWIYNGNL
jgi:3-isopropylmalate/(R)-2-methylmalate dehydratase small subunit